MTEQPRHSAFTPLTLDDTDRRVINALQSGFPICPRPFAQAAPTLNLTETKLIARLARLRQAGVLTRFGPLFQIEAAGGAYCLATMAVPDTQWETAVQAVNRHEEVAHNYRRDHALNMWFVLAADSIAGIQSCLRAIEQETGLPVLAFPKEREYFLHLKLEL